MSNLSDRLAESASGTWGQEAAVWLLDRHGHWLPELERAGYIKEDQGPGWTLTVITEGLDRRGSLVGTGSEWQVLDIAWALYFGEMTSLDRLSSLDADNRRLVLHAIAWAAGGRYAAETLHLLPS